MFMRVLSAFEMISSVIKAVGGGAFHLRQENEPNIESLASYLLRAVSIAMFAACIVIVTTEQQTGSPIHCLLDEATEDARIPENVINSFCFVSTTFTIYSHNAHTLHNSNEYIKGLGPDHQSRQYHSYYVWVPFILLAQCFIYLIPYCFWSSLENGLVGYMLCDLNSSLEIRISRKKKNRKVEKAADYFCKRLGLNSVLTATWFTSELLGLAIVLCNIVLYEQLLYGKFTKTGLGVLRGEEPNGIFPLLTKCTFRLYGPAGSVQLRDAQCVMNLNIYYEKMFVFFLFWFLFLATLFVYSIVKILCQIMCLKVAADRTWVATISIPSIIKGPKLPFCIAQLSFSDIFLFLLLAKNMRPLTYRMFVEHLLMQLCQNKKSRWRLPNKWDGKASRNRQPPSEEKVGFKPLLKELVPTTAIPGCLTRY